MREHDLRRDTFETRQHKFFAFAHFSFTEDAMTTLSFPYCPAEQRQGVRKKIRVAGKLQLLLQAANHAVFGRSQIGLKLRLARNLWRWGVVSQFVLSSRP